MKTKKKHLGSLIILRGVAALAVCFCHFGGAVYDPEYPIYIFKFLHDHGGRGVDVFFVVSGFVIPYSLYLGRYQISRFWVFMKKRLLRLQLPYVAALVLTGVLMYAAAKAKNEPMDFTTIDFIKSLFYIKIPSENPVFWSLRVEAQYYVYIGLIFALLVRHPLISAAVLLPATLLLEFIPGIELSLWTYLVYFNVGILGFMLYESLGQKWLNVAVITGLCAYIGWQSIPGLIATSGALLFILFYHSSVPSPLSFLGRISYSLYLIHFPIGIKLINLSSRYVPVPYRPVLFFIASVVVIGLAALFYQFFEKPAERLSKKYRYQQPPRTIPATISTEKI